MSGQLQHGFSTARLSAPIRDAYLHAKLLVCSTFGIGSRGERRITFVMLELRDRRWPDTKARFDSVVAQLDENSLCLDMGANAGLFTVQMAKTGATVHAFEPDPHAFKLLEAAAAPYANVHLHNAAIGPRDGTLTLTRDKNFADDPGRYTVGTGAFRSTLNTPGGESFDVPMIGLRSFLASLGRTVDLAKMDIEGSEVAVLEDLLDDGAISQVAQLFVETHEAQMPELRRRTRSLRKRVRKQALDHVHLDWQ